MAGEIKGLEIFGAGTWRPGNAGGGAVTVTEQALDEIVEAFDALQGSNIVKPHLKLGHTEAQKWFGQRNGIPTLGWIDRVWRDGSKLLADISNVPDALMKMIREKRYHNVSAEVFSPGVIEHNGKKFGHVLSAVALLGTEMPAVSSLAGLASALFADQFTADVKAAPVTYTQGTSNAMFTQEQVDSLIAAAVAKATGEVKAEFSTEVTNLKAERDVLKSRAEAAEGKIADQAKEFAKAEATRLVDDAIKAGRLLPKQKDMALAFMANAQGTINFGGADKSAVQLFGEFINSFGKQLDTTERGAGTEGSGAGTYATAAQEVADKVSQAMAKDSKLDYATALNSLLAANPDLKARYAAGGE